MPNVVELVAAILEGALIVVPALVSGAAAALMWSLRRQAKALPNHTHICFSLDPADFRFFLRGFVVLCTVISGASVRWFVVHTLPGWNGGATGESDLDDAMWGAIELALVLAPAVLLLRTQVRLCEDRT